MQGHDTVVPARPPIDPQIVTRAIAQTEAEACLPQAGSPLQRGRVFLNPPSTPMPNKQHLLTSIAAMARRLGRAPSLLEFVTGARIPKNSVFRLFPRWNDAVRAAGLQPHRLYLRPEDRELLTDWGETVRKLRAVPSRRAYDLNGKHYPITLEKRFGGWAALPQAFRDFATGKREWDDVLALVPDPGEPAVGAPDNPPALSQRMGARRTNASSLLPIPPKAFQHPSFKDRPTYGEPLDFPTMLHEPV